MKKGLTELVFILDRSGSMHNLTEDTIGGFNSMIDKQQKLEGETLVSTVLFNTENEVVHDRVPLENVPSLTDKEYVATGCTALIDAIGDSLHHISNVHKYIRDEDVPEKTVFVITTDGLENSSHRYSSEEVKRMISEKKKLGWEFLFLGANIDAVETAQQIGIDKDHAVDFLNDSEGIALNYAVVGETVRKMRCRKTFSPDWKEEIEADYKKRK